MAKAKFDIKTEATRPLYAYVGVADRAAEVVRESVADMQKRIEDVQGSVKELDLEPKALRDRAATRVTELQNRAKALPELVQGLLSDSEVAYDQLVERGERLVARIRRQESTQATVKSAKSATTKAKTTRTQATSAAKSTAGTAKRAAKSTASTARTQASRPKSSAKATGTTVRKTATKATRATADAAKKVGD
jgi:hypothetical protein